jgi:hypothetical protein
VSQTTWITGVSHGQVWLVATLLTLGTLATLAAYPLSTLRPPTRVASIFALGYAVFALTSCLLVIVHHLSPDHLAVALSLVCVALAAIIWKRRGQQYLRALRTELRTDWITLVPGLAVVVAVAVTRPSPVLGGWRYWADGAQIADAGRVPAVSPQWGTTFPPTVSKAAMNAFDAAASYLLGANLADAIGALTWFPAIGFMLGLWAFASEVGMRRMAPLVALAGVSVVSLPFGIAANQEIASDLQQFKAEDFGRMTAFTALALAIRLVREGGGLIEAAVVGSLFAVAATTHLLPTVICLCLLAGVLIVGAVRSRGFPMSVRTTGMAAACLIGLAVALPVLSGGDIGFQGATSAYEPFHVPGRSEGLDPTAAFVRRFKPFQGGHGHWLIHPASIVSDAVSQATGLANPPTPWILLSALLLTALAVALPNRVTLGITAALALAAALIAGAIVFSFRYHTVVPGRFGEKRLFDYIALPWILIAGCAAEAMVALAGRLRARAASLLAVSVTAIAAFGLLATQPGFAGPPPPAVSAYENLMATIQRATPCGARILLNFRSTGSVQLLAGRVAVLEGMAPYLRPRLLNPTLATLYGAREFFQDPATNAGYLTEHDVNYIVVASGQDLANAGYNAHMARHTQTTLSALPKLTLVQSSPHLQIYRVSSTPVPPHSPPGYPCRDGHSAGTA